MECSWSNGKDMHNPHFLVRYIKEGDGPEETIIILNWLFNNQLFVAYR